MGCKRSANHVVLGLLTLMCVLATGGCSLLALKSNASLDVPKTPPDNTLAVFYFRPKGDTDAKLYSGAFARALSDRLYCAPDYQISQPTAMAIEEQLNALKHSWRDAITDDIAKRAGGRLGARYVITGDFQLHGRNADVSVYMSDLTKASSKPFALKQSGELSDLPQMQTAMVSDIVRAMNKDPKKALSGSYGKPNFTKPSTLLLYGQSLYSKDAKQAMAYRWQDVRDDPDSLFATLRVLGTYVYGSAPCTTIRSDSRLQALAGDAAKRFADNAEIGYLIGWLYIQQYQYKTAEAYLHELVGRAPDYTRGRDALANVATYRGDSALAVEEARKLVDIWPTSARSHLVLADAYRAAASDARRGHFYGDMTMGVRRKWQRSLEQAYREACITLRLDPQFSMAWGIVMDCSRELGYRDYDRRAFEEMVKLDPKNYSAYSGYANSLVSQWGGTEPQRQALYIRVDKAFGKDSVESCLIRGHEMLCELEHDALRPEILRLADMALQKSKGKSLDALDLKCTVMIGLHRRAEMLEIAKKGFAADPSPRWRMLLARGYEFRWDEMHDQAALPEAQRLLAVYVDELPFESAGHDHLGWCLSHLGHRAEAKKEFLRALEIDPSDSMAKEKMVYVQ